jgi:Family of unknown function (DUF5330)
MWFLLRMTFWLGVVLVLLPNVGWQSVPKSQINASEALLAAKDIVTDIQHICERQREACAVGSQTTVTLGQRAQVGAKILYEFLSEQFGSYGRRPEQITASPPIPPRTPLQDTLRPADLVPPWRAPQPVDNEHDKRPAKGRTHATREFDN